MAQRPLGAAQLQTCTTYYYRFHGFCCLQLIHSSGVRGTTNGKGSCC